MKKLIKFSAKNPVLITAIICVIFYFLPFKPKPFGDGDFHTGTQELIRFILNGFQGDVNVTKGFLTLFCYLIPYAIVYTFHQDKLFFISSVIFSCFFVCLSVRFLFKALDILKYSDKTKCLTLLVMSLFPIHIYYAMGVIGEVFGFFASSMILYFLIKINYGNCRRIDFFYLALSFVLLYGIKPNMLPFIIVMTAYFLFMKNKREYKLFFTLGILLIPVLILAERNLDKYGYDFKNATFGNQILWSRFELRDEPFNWVPQHGKGDGTDEFISNDYLNNLKKRRELDSICTTDHYSRTPYFIKWVKNDIISNPLLTLRQYSLKFFQAQSFIISPLIKSKKSALTRYGIHIYINLINYILVFVGLFSMYKLFRQKNYKLFVPFLFFWGWCLLYVFVFHSEQRYMFPFRPILIFLFGFYLNIRNAHLIASK